MRLCRKNKHPWIEGARQCKQCKKEANASYHKIYYEHNKEALIERSRKFYKEKLGLVKSRQKIYYDKTSDEQKRRSREFYKSNLAFSKAKNHEYYKNNPEKSLAQQRKRQLAKIRRTPPWLTKEHFEQIAAFYKTAKEMKILTGDSYHVDHIIPLQGKTVSGLHVPWNLQVIRAEDNLRKSNNLEKVS